MGFEPYHVYKHERTGGLLLSLSRKRKVVSKITLFDMPLGILETKDDQAEVPGTCLLTDDPNQKATELYKGLDISKLKHGTGKC